VLAQLESRPLNTVTRAESRASTWRTIKAGARRTAYSVRMSGVLGQRFGAGNFLRLRRQLVK